MNNMRKKIYDKDTMTAEERFDAVIRLEKPDRVPLSMMLYYYGPFHTDTRMSEYMNNPEVYMKTMRAVYNDLGPWDIYYNINPVSRLIYSFVLMMKYLYPGDELPDNEISQVDEVEFMKEDDYDWILKSSYYLTDLAFRSRLLPRFCKEARGLGTVRLLLKLGIDMIRQRNFCIRDRRWWIDQGLTVLSGYQAEMPFDVFSQARTIVPFTMDLFQRPEKIRRAASRLAPSFAESAIQISKLMGVPRVQCYCHRTSNTFISPRQFDELVFPSLEEIVCRIVDAGMTPILHCDGNWLKNLKTMRKLPAKKIVIQLDGLTDIFRAKQEIGDCMCIFGDVNAEKLALADPQEVDEYCHRLIEEVGKDGGFILAAACEIPYNAKPENLKAMTKSVYKYGYYV